MEDCRKSIEKLFKRFKGQPVEILTDDGVRYCGIDLNSDDESVEIIDKCSRVIFIPFRHIDAVVEPKMKLITFCGDKDCDCDDNDDNDDDDDCDRNGRDRDRNGRDRDRNGRDDGRNDRDDDRDYNYG